MLGYKYNVLSHKITKLRMAYRGIFKITTTEILEELKRRNGNNSDLFYLYLSTSRDDNTDDTMDFDDHNGGQPSQSELKEAKKNASS